MPPTTTDLREVRAPSWPPLPAGDGGWNHRAVSRARRRLTSLFRLLFIGLLYYLTATAVLDAFMTHWAMGDAWRKSRFNRVIHYTTERPFVHRVLTPSVINAITDVLPEGAAERLAARTAAPRQRYGLRPGNDAQYFVGYLVLLACLLGVLLTWRASLSWVYGFPANWIDLAPPILLIFYPMLFMKGGFVYDFPELLLSSIALHAFLRERWWLYFPVFAIAILNKETAILMVVWFLARFLVDRNPRRLMVYVGLSAATGLPPLLAVRAYWSGHPGSGMDLNLSHNLAYFSQPSSFWSGFDAYAAGLPAPQGFHPVNLLFLATILVLSWRRAPRVVWWTFVLTALVILPLYLVFGWEDELRVFGPALPALALLAAWTLRGVYSEIGRPPLEPVVERPSPPAAESDQPGPGSDTSGAEERVPTR